MTIVSFLFDTAKNNIPYLMDLLLKADFYRLLETLATVVIFKSHLELFIGNVDYTYPGARKHDIGPALSILNQVSHGDACIRAT